jgi:hypothetical protein
LLPNSVVVGDEHDSLVPVETAVGQSFAFPLLATTLVGQQRAAEHAGPIAEY